MSAPLNIPTFTTSQRCSKCQSIIPETSIREEKRRDGGGKCIKAHCPHCGQGVKLNYSPDGKLRGGELLDPKEAVALRQTTQLVHGDFIAD